MSLTQINKAGLDEIALDHVFTIGASGNSAYTFQGEGLNGTVNNPTLYLTRGKTYRFENGTGAHAIRIQSADNGVNGTLYNTGVTNNNTTGTVIVEVQHDAPDVLYYQCAVHASMKGTLYITGALADGGVTTAKLASGAVTEPKISSNAVISSKIADGAVIGTKLATNAVTTAKIADGAVTTAKLPDSTGIGNGVTTAKIANGAITTAKIAAGNVTLDRLEPGVSNTNGKFLRANNNASPSFEVVPTTTINNNADNRVITGSGTASTLNGEANCTFNGDSLGLNSSSTTEINLQTSNNTRFKVQAGSNFAQLLTQNDVPLTFKTDAGTSGGTERMRINTNGNVGIGTGSPNQQLHVYNAATDSSSYIKVENNRSRNAAVQFTTTQGSWYVGQGIGADVDRFMVYDSAERFSIDSGGHARIYNGNLEIGTNGRGIDFSAQTTTTTTNSTAGSELLDHYEEGTWTPLFQYYTGSGWADVSFDDTPDNSVGRYVRVGSLVHCWYYSGSFSTTSAANHNGARISGLPFVFYDGAPYHGGVFAHSHTTCFKDQNNNFFDCHSGYGSYGQVHYYPSIGNNTNIARWGSESGRYIMIGATYQTNH